VPPPVPGAPRASSSVPTIVPPTAPDLPKLVCDAGTTVTAAAFPDPTWYCATPDGTKQGRFETLFPSNQIAIEGSYKQNKLDGVWKRHYSNGAIAEEGGFVGGLPDGTWRQLDPNGGVLGEYTLKAGTGRQKKWLADGSLYTDTMLRKGVRHGAMRMFDHNVVVVIAKYLAGRLDDKHLVGNKGNLRIEETFAHGARTGPRQIWQFGVLIFDENYDDKGKLDGAYTLFRDNKFPRMQGTYEHGKKTGTWTWNDKNNKKEREGDFALGKRSGTWSEWNDERLTFQGLYVDGKPDGDFVYYDAKTGTELGRFTMKDGTGTMVTFYPNKKPATKTRMYKGAMDGKYEELTQLGKTTVEGRYANDRKHGAWHEQTPAGVATLDQMWKRGKLDGTVKKYANGKLASQATYKDGKAEGAYAEYRDGKPALTGQFAADKRVGTWTTYAADGSVMLTAAYKDGVLDGPWHQVIAGGALDGQMKAGRRAGTWSQTDRAGKAYSVSYKTP